MDTHVFQYRIPMEDFPARSLPLSGKVIGFIGNYAHAPNLDALSWLTGTLIPAIRAKCHDARFILAGKGIPPSIREKHGAVSSVEFREDVADLSDFYSDKGIFINPIISGRGMRTKLNEAAAFGRPTVPTSLGAECLGLSTVDDGQSIADACTRLLRANDNPERIARNRQAVIDRFSLSKVAGDFLSLIAGRSGLDYSVS